MALHIDLPIYKLAYDLLDVATDLTRNMPRDFKASLGGQIRNECVMLMVLIGRANVAKDKVPHLDAMLEGLQVVELLMRLSHDKRFISPKQWARSIELTNRIGAQTGGWRNWSKGNSTSATPQQPQRPLHAGQGRHA
jgi:hypothetical protein